MTLRSYKELEVWQKAMLLVGAIYRITDGFPKDERFGLTQQMRRAAISIPANIAEGYGRKHRGDYLHHLSISTGSLYELDTHTDIALLLGYVKAEEAQKASVLMADVRMMLSRLKQSLDMK